MMLVPLNIVMDLNNVMIIVELLKVIRRGNCFISEKVLTRVFSIECTIE